MVIYMNETEQMKAVRLLRSFWEVNKNMMRLIQQTAVENGLTVPQYTVLVVVTQHIEIVQKNVGELTFLPKSTLSQAVEGLVQLELIERKQVEGNRREMLLSVTEKGLDFLKSIHKQKGGIHQVFHFAIEEMTDNQYEELLNVHAKIVIKLEDRTMK